MEMIDVLKKLEEIAQTRPELVADAVDNVTRTNPAAVQDNAVKTDEGGMSDVHIGAQEVIGQYADEDGNLKMPKQDVLRAMAAEKEKAAFPLSYEIETAMGMVNDKFSNDGIAKDDMDMSSEQPETNESPYTSDTEGAGWLMANKDKIITQLFAGGVQSVLDQKDAVKAISDLIPDVTEQEIITILKKSDAFVSADNGDDGRAQNAYKLARDQGEVESKQLNTNTMKTEDKKQVNESKKPVKEAIQISTDSPQEASMMMQLLKLAGVQQVDQDMINQEPEAPAENPAHGEEGHDCGCDSQDDAMGSGEMGGIRDMIAQADGGEQAEENFANSMGDEKEEPKYQDTDTLVNFHSGGLNSQKQQVRKEYPGDNPLAVKEDTITAESLANSLREQYDTFKETYTKVAETKAKPDFLDMDKDGNKKEPMKKAIKDKKAK